LREKNLLAKPNIINIQFRPVYMPLTPISEDTMTLCPAAYISYSFEIQRNTK